MKNNKEIKDVVSTTDRVYNILKSRFTTEKNLDFVHSTNKLSED